MGQETAMRIHPIALAGLALTVWGGTAIGGATGGRDPLRLAILDQSDYVMTSSALYLVPEIR